MSRTEQMKSAALDLVSAGVYIFPLKPKGKMPLIDAWHQRATVDHEQVHNWWGRWPEANIAVHLGLSGLAVIDVDPRNYGDQTFTSLVQRYGEGWISHIQAETGGGGQHYFYRCDRVDDLPAQLGPGVDLKRGNGYVLIAPSVHPNGTPYRFEGDDLTGGNLDFAPALPSWCYRFAGTAIVDRNDWTASIKQSDPETPENVARVQSALKYLDADCSRDEWRDIGFAILSTGWACATDLFRDWSTTAPSRFSEDGFDNIVDNFQLDRPNGIGLGSLFAKATAAGWTDQRTVRHAGIYGDISNGRRFAAAYQGEFLFVHASGEWFQWTGSSWQPAQNGEVHQAAKQVAEECLDEAYQAFKAAPSDVTKRARSQAEEVYRRLPRLEAMLTAASSEPGMSIAHPGLFDANPWQINTRNGLLNLQTGALTPPSPDMLVSRQTGCEYDKFARCDRWLTFLDQAMNGEQETVDFLQRVCGYGLTGLVDEEVLFFFYGHGANGKSVFANVLLAALGQYAVTVRAALLARDIRGNSGDAEREKARLPGARIALLNETAQSDVWDDQRLKELVSRENVSARRLYGESFEFTPTHKLFVRGNHQPGALDASDGFWRRIILLGFTRKFEAHERIPDLDRQIIDNELAGVLAWMVDGCLAWQQRGLDVPAKIAEAVEVYRTDTDLLGEWLRSECRTERGKESLGVDLFRSFVAYLEDARVKPPSRNAFGRQLMQRGFRKRESNGKTYYAGLTLRDPFEGDEL
ncbi:MAG: phage/plasmid primase, P4 family [Azonexaceae bacterium]|nr:phage/plasmid primase, P4 family [Azonexaceae bacterium]